MTTWRVALPIVLLCGVAAAAPREVVSREGQKLLESTAFIRGFWPSSAYQNAWKTWGVGRKPADYGRAFRERYGLAEAPYPNGDLPMGLRPANMLFGTGIGIDCMTCHGGELMGKGVVGMGNGALDIHSLFTEMTAATGSPVAVPFQFSRARGTTEAGAFSVYLLGLRNADLTLAPRPRELGVRDDSVEDVPAWWLLKKKKTMYYTGTTSTDSARSLMQFLMHPLTTRPEFDKAEPAFEKIREYLKSIPAPKYPFAIDETRAAAGKVVFADNCARCHGTYGDDWTYPNKIIAIDKIGTDRKRYDNIRAKFAEAYAESWFAQDGHPVADTAGYQAPPLDGVWATAPYLHNGSVPTVAGLLDSTSRPASFTRSFRTGAADFDEQNLGWKFAAAAPAPADAPGIERRKVYDTSRPGQSNAGHTYGDGLSVDERRAVIEYLKTL